MDVLITDTAGRLHTQVQPQRRSWAKLRGVAQKQVHQAPHECLLVLDATTGQNALNQAKVFTEAVGVTGTVPGCWTAPPRAAWSLPGGRARPPVLLLHR